MKADSNQTTEQAFIAKKKLEKEEDNNCVRCVRFCS